MIRTGLLMPGLLVPCFLVPCLLVIGLLGFNQSLLAYETPLTTEPSNALRAGVSENSVTIMTVDGQTYEATLGTISEDGTMSGDQIPEGLSLNDVTSISTTGSIENAKTDLVVRLVGGGEFRATSVAMQNSIYTIETPTASFSLGAESIQAIVSTESTGSSLLNRLIGEPDTSNDRIIVDTSRGEQAVTGILEEINEEKIIIDVGGKTRSITRSKVKLVGVVLTDLLQSVPDGTIARINLLDGSHAVGRIKSLDETSLKIVVAGDAELTLDRNQVAAINVRSDRITYLSDLAPVDIEERSIGSASYTWQSDRNVFGEPLTLYSSEDEYQEFQRGIGTHSYCRLEFEVADGFGRFNATVGLDKQSQQRGDCEVSVRGDGIELWSGQLNRDNLIQEIDVDIEGVSRLTLLVKPGKHLDLGDHVNWVNAKLLKVD